MRVAVLARVSTDEQAQKETIQIQTEFATKYCDLHKHTIYDLYCDDGVSGTIPVDQRGQGRRLLQDARLKRFDAVLVYKLDRLGRSCRVILNAVDDLESAGIPVISMTEPFDTSNPFGRFVLTILAAVAEFERENILERTENGKRKRASNGQWAGGLRPYGYDVDDDGHLIPNLDVVEVVRFLFQHVAFEHGSLVSSAKQLNARGVLSPRGGTWDFTTIWRILTNPVYKGTCRYSVRGKREVIEYPSLPLVSPETWELTQRRLQENKKFSKRGSKREYLLSGLLTCGTCGGAYCGMPRHNGVKEYVYYVCNRKNKAYIHEGKKSCTSPGVRAEELDQGVWADVERILRHPEEMIEELAQKIHSQAHTLDDLQGERAQLEVTLLEKDEERERMLGLYRTKRINLDALDRHLQQVDEEEATLKARIAYLDDRARGVDTLQGELTDAEHLLKELSENLEDADFEQKKRICRRLIREVVIRQEEGQAVADIVYKPADVGVSWDKHQPYHRQPPHVIHRVAA